MPNLRKKSWMVSTEPVLQSDFMKRNYKGLEKKPVILNLFQTFLRSWNAAARPKPVSPDKTLHLLEKEHRRVMIKKLRRTGLWWRKTGYMRNNIVSKINRIPDFKCGLVTEVFLISKKEYLVNWLSWVLSTKREYAQDKGLIVSKANFLVLDFSKKQT